MKSNYCSIFIFFVFAVQSQPVLTSADFVDFAANVYKSNMIPDVGSAGVNQTWDFSSVTYDSNIYSKFETVPPATAMPNFGSEYNYVERSTLFNADGTISSYNYSKYILSPTGLENGVNVSVNATTNSASAVSYTNEYIYALPMVYGSIASDTYQVAAHYTIPYTVTRIYDGYGTLVTPFGTFTDVIREKTTQVGDGSLVGTSYTWLKVNPRQLLMQANFYTNLPAYTSVYFFENLLLSNDTFAENSSLQIYPNPASSILNIKPLSNQNIDKISVCDMLGKVVLEPMPNISQIDISGLANGMYILETFSGEKKYQQKFIKQ